jgi:hypothetical protein
MAGAARTQADHRAAGDDANIRAGEGPRTLDVHLGKMAVALRDFKHIADHES